MANDIVIRNAEPKDYDFILNVGKLPHSVQELGSVQPLSRVQLFATP